MKTQFISIKRLTIAVLLLVSLLPIKADGLSEEETRQFDYFFMEACHNKMQGNYQAAIEMFQKCLSIAPTSAISHFEVGKILLLSGNDNDAVNFLKKAVVLNSKNEWYQIYLAGVYEHTQDYPSAIEVYNQLHAAHPDKIEYFYHLGDLYTKTNAFFKAIEVYDELEKQEGINEPLVLEKQRLYMLAGEEKKALSELNKLLKESPTDVRYQIMLGDYYMNIQNAKKAKTAYDKATEMNSENGYLHLSLSSYYENMNNKGKALDELKIAFGSDDIAYEQKIQILLQYMMAASNDKTLAPAIEELTPVIINKYPDEANTYFFYANFLIDDTAKADIVVENLEKSVELDASNEDAWTQLIQMAFNVEDYEKVMQYSKGAALGNVNNPYIYFYSGIAAQQLDDLESAKNDFEAAINLTPEDNSFKSQLLGCMGDLYYEMEDSKKAFGYYEAALALNAHNEMVLNNYAYYLSEEDTLLTKAETMSAKCIELAPGNATYLDTYAWILFKRGNYLLAKFYMEKAIHNIEEENDVLYDHYGDILYGNDDLDEAKEYWQKAIDAGGDAKVIGEKLKR